MMPASDQLIDIARTANLVEVIKARGILLKQKGSDFVACCPFHEEKTPSFKVTPAKNLFHCFGCGAGGDAIEFLKRFDGVSFPKAVQLLAGNVCAESPPRVSAKIELEPARSQWELVIPVPDGAPTTPLTRRAKDGDAWTSRHVSAKWDYRNESGELVGYTCRFELEGGGKEILPLSYCRNSETGELSWRWQAFGKPRPLFGLDRLFKNPKAQVLIVEGEKATLAAQRQFEELKTAQEKLVVLTWPGGANGVRHVDWALLNGREVGFWPDADGPGYAAVLEAGALLSSIAKSIKVILPPSGVALGWDLADEAPQGFDLKKHTREFAMLFDDFALQFAQIAPAAAVDQTSSELDSATISPVLEDFWAYLPMHQYIYIPTGELWPAASVNGNIREWPLNPETSKPIKPSDWMDRDRAVQQMSWHPGRPTIMEGEVVSKGGWAPKPGARVFNLYQEPVRQPGDAAQAGPWLEHLRKLYPDDWEHIQCWLAHRIQYPGEKINHALVLGGNPGVGKDTLLEPVKAGVGAWNWSEVAPQQIIRSDFNPWVQCTVVRVSELRDLKEDRFSFHETMKTYTAAPPDSLLVNQKHMREYYVPNVMGVLFTTNNRTDGLYLPADDRRHYVAWSEAQKEDFSDSYWTGLWQWLGQGGTWHVIEYLRTLDLAGFNPKAPPLTTAAFWTIVHANNAPEDAELSSIFGEDAGVDAIVLADVIEKAKEAKLDDLADELGNRKLRRSIPHKLARIGYVPVHNPDAKDRQWAVEGQRVTVYASKNLNISEQVRAARSRAALIRGPL
jgi:hypothetical protein